MLLAALRSADLLPPVLTIECLAASPDVGCAVLTVTRPVEAGELLLELPGTAALTKDSAQDTSLLQYLDPEDGRPPPKVQALVASVGAHRQAAAAWA